LGNAKNPFKNIRLEITADRIILGKLNFKECFYASGRIECTFFCAYGNLGMKIKDQGSGIGSRESEIGGKLIEK